MKILIHEPNHSGHRFTTVRVLINSLSELRTNHKVDFSITLATTQSGLESVEYQEQLLEVESELLIYVVPEFNQSKRPVVLTAAQVRGLRKVLKHSDYDHIYLPYADAQLQLLTLSRLIPFQNVWPPKGTVEAQLMKSSFAYPYSKRIGRALTLLTLRFSGVDRIHLNDALGSEYLKDRNAEKYHHVRCIPDPISETRIIEMASARETLNLPKASRIVGCMGLINERKGADVLIRSFMEANLLENDLLLLAGRLSKGCRSLVDGYNDPRIITLDRYLTETELSLAISAVNLVATPYPPVIGSASIIIRAAIASKMVLSCETGWAGAMVKKYRLGNTAPVEDLPQFAERLEKSLEESIEFKTDQASVDFVQFNSIENVHSHWVDLLKSKLNIQSRLKSL